MTIIDIRPESDYRKSHLPGAVNIWRPAIAADGLAYSSITASKEKLEHEFGKLGILPDQLVVVYDGQMSADAANLRWIMRLHGKRDVQILQGGIQGWMAVHHPTDTGIVRLAPTRFQFAEKPDSSYYASLKDVQSAVGDPHSLLVDTRTFEEFTGAKIKEGARRGGHIPGSIWLNYSDATVDSLGCNHLKSRSELEALFAGKGVTKDRNIICYCHSGVRSAFVTMVLSEVLGYPSVRNYDGSWEEWSHIDSLPAALGDELADAAGRENVRLDQLELKK